MYLTVRSGNAQDFEPGFLLVKKQYFFDIGFRENVLRLWKRLVDENACIFNVVEDRDRPRDRRLAMFGILIFATDDLLCEAKTTLKPFLPRQVVERFVNGPRPFMNVAEIAKANATDGINIVSLHYGFDSSYSPEEIARIYELIVNANVASMKTYRMKEFLEEVYGAEQRGRFFNLGCDLRRNYEECVASSELPSDLEERHPYLMGTIVSEARTDPKKAGTILGEIVSHRDPRFLFSLREQELLRQAMLGLTDEEIGSFLCITLMAVKKRWQGIYEKVESVDPELFEDRILSVVEGMPRQRQRRRQLVQFVQAHPEELWPPQKVQSA